MVANLANRERALSHVAAHGGLVEKESAEKARLACYFFNRPTALAKAIGPENSYQPVGLRDRN